MSKRRTVLMCRKPAALAALTLACATLLAAAEPWEAKPYTEWTEKEVARILEDSPWAKGVGGVSAVLRSVELPSVAPPPSPSITIPGTTVNTLPALVQWASSLTLRQAWAREGELRNTMTKEQAAQLLATPFTQYVILVRGPGVVSMLESFDQLTEDIVKQSVYLQPRSSKEKIHPVGIEIDAATEVPVASFYFPRQADGQPTIAPDEQKVEFHWVSPRHEFNLTFDLSEMVRAARPDL